MIDIARPRTAVREFDRSMIQVGRYPLVRLEKTSCLLGGTGDIRVAGLRDSLRPF
jgi:hypothetical protein